MNIFKKPYDLFLIAVVIFGILTGIWLFSDKTVDISFGKTFLVMRQWQYTMVFLVFFLLFWLLYRGLHTYLYSVWLTKIQVLVTLFSTIIIFIFYPSESNHWMMSQLTDASGVQDILQYSKYINSILIIAFSLWIIGWAIFCFHLFLGINDKWIAKSGEK
jgi:hypothetical protein